MRSASHHDRQGRGAFQRTTTAGAGAVLALGAVVHLAGAQAPDGARSAVATGAAARHARRTAVEQGLRAAVQLGERPAAGWTLAERMRRYGVPGVSVAVVRCGAIDWAAGYGVVRADPVARPTARPTTAMPVIPGAVTTATRFQAASISKLVTAVLALRLVDAGRLSLDADVRGTLRRWQVPAPAEPSTGGPGSPADAGAGPAGARPVTLRQLLSHSAGVNVAGFPGYPADAALPTLVQLLDGVPPANSPPVRLDGPPGTYRYSGGGYQIVQLLLEDATGRPFAALADDHVLAPLGMTQSAFAPVLPPAWAGEAAAGHRFDGQPVPGGAFAYPELAAAALWSTPSDLARLAVGIMHAYRPAPCSGSVPTRERSGPAAPRATPASGGQPLLEHATALRLLTRTVGDAGLGPGVHGTGTALHFDHAGWTQGFRAYLVAYPARGDGVVVMTNHDGGHELIGELVRGVAHVYGWPDFRPVRHPAVRLRGPALQRRLRACAGTFRVRAWDLPLTVRAARDPLGAHLVLRTPRGTTYHFYPTDVTPSHLRFVSLEDGAVLSAVGPAGARDGSADTGEPAGGCAALELWGARAERTSPPTGDGSP